MRFTKRFDEVSAEIMERMGSMDHLDDPSLGNLNATDQDIIKPTAQT